MSNPSRLVTAAELEKFPDDDYRYETLRGSDVVDLNDVISGFRFVASEIFD